MANILFVCTGNSCRSILAEAIFNHYGHGLITAFSAGTNPVGEVNLGAEACLYRHGMTHDGFQSTHWAEYDADSEIQMDAVITLCDNAAMLEQPTWMGNPAQIHWSLNDPAAFVNDAREMTHVFEEVFQKLEGTAKSLMVEMDKNPTGIDLSVILKLLSYRFEDDLALSA